MYVIIFNPKQGETMAFAGQNGRKHFEYTVNLKPTGDGPRADYGIDPLKERKLFYCDNEANAKLLAEKLAQDNPGSELLVLTEVVMFQSIPPKEKIEVVEKAITAEGVLPR
jgi:hypothetical protein